MFKGSTKNSKIRASFAALMLLLVVSMGLAANQAWVGTGNELAASQQTVPAPISNGPSGAAQAPQDNRQTTNDAGSTTARVGREVKHDTSPALRDMVSQP